MSREIVYMGDHTILTRLIYGPKIYVDTRDISLASHIILDGHWESWVTNIFMSTVKPGMTVLDIGSNCGYYALLAAHLAGPHGTVHAFEPNPFHHENFIKSKLVNGYSQLHLHKVALADQEGEMTLYSPVKLTGGASFHKEFATALGDMDQFTSIKVPTVDLSAYLPNLKADVIKIDIECAEPLIMDSIFRVINNSDELKIIMEYNQHAWSSFGYDCESILNRFTKHGFQIYIIHHDSTLIPVTSKDLIQKSTRASHFDLYISNGKQ